MNPEELDECYEFVKKLVLDCGEVLKTGFKNPGTVTTKEGAHDLGLLVSLFDWQQQNKYSHFQSLFMTAKSRRFLSAG